jgi:zinc protease
MFTTFMAYMFSGMPLQNAHAVDPLALPSWKKVDGVDTILAEKHDTPLTTFVIAFPVGGYSDPSGKLGVASLTGDMLLRGTQSKTREQIENLLDHLGASLSVDVGYQSFMVKGQVLSRNLSAVLDLVSEMLSKPTFPQEEINRRRDQLIAQLNLELENDAAVARKMFRKVTFEGHPYQLDTVGSPDTLKNIERNDIVQFHRANLKSGGMILGAAGDVTPADLKDIVNKIRSQIPEGSTEKTRIPVQTQVKGKHVLLVDKPERSQTQFYIGHPSIDTNHKDYFPLNLFMTAFAGHNFQAQYMQEIRVKRGWAYGADGAIDARPDGGMFYLHTYPAVKDTVPAITVSLELLKNAIHGNGITDAQIEFAKTYLIRSYPFMIDTVDKILSQLMANRLMGRPDDYLETYMKKIQSVTPSQARESAKRHLSDENFNVVVLCTAIDIQKTIGAAVGTKDVKVVPFDKF